ncbi:MAG: DNA cytosine methyltransferase, partial [Zoogloeaceae bacterium]|nr:DNA cytosine methyltransferase [Zoogloeaceae bacterium]
DGAVRPLDEAGTRRSELFQQYDGITTVGIPCLQAGEDVKASNCAKGVNNQTPLIFCPDVARTLLACSSGSPSVDRESESIAVSSGVRRLTPRECERLQGFPDDYTLVPYRGKPAADMLRYRAIGNSMAVPAMRWIGEKLWGNDGPPAKPWR